MLQYEEAKTLFKDNMLICCAGAFNRRKLGTYCVPTYEIDIYPLATACRLHWAKEKREYNADHIIVVSLIVGYYIEI